MAYPFRIATQLQYYVKREKCKVNDVIFQSGCKARAINLGNKNMKIGIFAGGTSVRWKNIFTDTSGYPTGKREIKYMYLLVPVSPRDGQLRVCILGLKPISKHRRQFTFFFKSDGNT